MLSDLQLRAIAEMLDNVTKGELVYKDGEYHTPYEFISTDTHTTEEHLQFIKEMFEKTTPNEENRIYGVAVNINSEKQLIICLCGNGANAFNNAAFLASSFSIVEALLKHIEEHKNL